MASEGMLELELSWWRRWRYGLIGCGVFVAFFSGGQFLLHQEESRLEAERTVGLVLFGSSLQARLSRELSSVLYLTSGLGSYFEVRRGDVDPAETQEILAKLFASTRHVRNFGVAEGYRVKYVYPAATSEKAIGLYYPDLPEQWAAVKRVVESRMPVLAGPVDLKHGGRGLIYRAPVYVEGKYWGLLSTVIDTDSLFGSVFKTAARGDVVFAVRGKDGLGSSGAVFWGNPKLFEVDDVELFDVEVPGGKWLIAVQAKAALDDARALWLMHALLTVLAAFLGWSAYLLLKQRAQLTFLALYDSLTGLPNRHLVEDRIQQALAARRRDESKVCVVMFFDLDGFKTVNDRYGHKAGDALLQGVATRVRAAVRAADTVGRWGGDEFLVLFESVAPESVPRLTDTIRQAATSEVGDAGATLRVTAAVGVAVAPADGETVGALVRVADQRMYEQKQASGREAR